MAHTTRIFGSQENGFSNTLKVMIVTTVLDHFDRLNDVFVVKDSGSVFFIRDYHGNNLFKVDSEKEEIIEIQTPTQ